MNLFLGVIVFLSVIERSSQLPLVCKEGKFYEDSVFDYFNCSLCIEQSHYANCDVCCTSKCNFDYYKILAFSLQFLSFFLLDDPGDKQENLP